MAPIRGILFDFGEVFPLFDAVSFSYEVGAFKPGPRLLEDVRHKGS